MKTYRGEMDEYEYLVEFSAKDVLGWWLDEGAGERSRKLWESLTADQKRALAEFVCEFTDDMDEDFSDLFGDGNFMEWLTKKYEYGYERAPDEDDEPEPEREREE